MHRLAAAAVIGVLGVVGAVPAWAAPSFRGLIVQPPQPAAEFVLLDQHRHRFALREQRGHAVVLVFGYTHCRDICPATLAMLKLVHRALGAETGRVRFAFVTTDPERDTPERLKTYLAIFHQEFIGLTGPRATLTRVHEAYGIYPQRYTAAGSSAGYLVGHATPVYLIDPAGTLRFSYPWGINPDDLAGDLRLVLQGY